MVAIFPPQGTEIVGLPDYVIVSVSGATHTTALSDQFLAVSYTATGAVAITLSANSLISGNQIIIKDTGGGATTNNITISTAGTEKIDGQDTYVIVGDYDSITIVSDGSNWWIV